MKKMGTLDWVVLILISIGAVNWGLYGLFDYDVVTIVGTGTIATIVYVLVALAGLYNLYNALK